MGTLSRRAFVTYMTGALSVSLLAACGQAAPSAPAPGRDWRRETSWLRGDAGSGGEGGDRTAEAGWNAALSFVGDITNVDGHYYSPKFGLWSVHYLRHTHGV